MDSLNLILLWVMAVPCTLYSFWYGISAPWTSTWVGRANFTSSASLALIVDMSLVFRQWPPPALVVVITVLVVFPAVAVAKSGLLAALVHGQCKDWHAAHRTEKEADHG